MVCEGMSRAIWRRRSRERWVAENARVYCETGKLVEKYNVRDAGEGAGGEYPVQDGFGWTNARADQAAGDLSGARAQTLRVHRERMQR